MFGILHKAENKFNPVFFSLNNKLVLSEKIQLSILFSMLYFLFIHIISIMNMNSTNLIGAILFYFIIVFVLFKKEIVYLIISILAKLDIDNYKGMKLQIDVLNGLFKIIKVHQLYETKTNIFNKEILTAYQNIGFIVTRNRIIIRVYGQSNSWIKKVSIDNMQLYLENEFGLIFDEINDTNPQYTDYYALLEKPRRLSVSEIINDKSNYNELIFNNLYSSNINLNPHLLCVGKTGSGKTTFLKFAILHFIKVLKKDSTEKNLDIYIADPKRSDLVFLAEYFGNENVASTGANIARILREVNQKMNERYKNYSSLTGNTKDLKPIIVVVDELSALNAEDAKIAKECQSYLKQLVLKGRQQNIFVILGMQMARIDDFFSSDIRAQFSIRVGLQNLSLDEQRMIFGDTDVKIRNKGLQSAQGYYMDNSCTSPRFIEIPEFKNDSEFQILLDELLS
ncbi:energy-coupling factor transporter ATP-binding protein EcfA2 [Bacilli bacterium PM5-9]|nr:energy-coupling factor transporter ATP-binding protein EcfA2 [Bacilli bacterium PM5-9]